MDKRLANKVTVRARVLANAQLREYYDPDKTSDLARQWAPFTGRWREDNGSFVVELELRDDPRSRAIIDEPWPGEIARAAIKQAMRENIMPLVREGIKHHAKN